METLNSSQEGDPTEDLVGDEKIIYDVLLAKISSHTPREAVAMSKQIFLNIEAMQAEAENSEKQIDANTLALNSNISPDLAGAILRRLGF